MPSASLDKLFTTVAKKVLTETLHVQRGECVTVEAWDSGLQFARRAVAEARALGCSAIMVYEDEAAYVEGVRRAPADSLGKMGKNEYGLLAGTDAYIFVPGQALAAYSRTLKPGELTDSTRYNSSWYDAAEKAGLRGARLSFGYVGRDLARILGKSVKEIVRAQLKAALVDFGEVGGSARRYSGLLGDGASGEVLSAGGSRLSFSFKGDLTIEDGVIDEDDRREGNNMTYLPPGLMTKEVDSETTEGTVTISDSLTKFGIIHRAKLQFKGGRLVNWTSPQRTMMQKLIGAIAPEKRRASILGIGFNDRLNYGNGQDRFVAGSVTISGFGFTGVAKGAGLVVGGTRILRNGSFV
jgi:leucyl aminopeptidase (aminopeptidase T)